MSAIVNDRDVQLQATVPRYTTRYAGTPTILLSSSAPVFRVSSTGVVSPSSIIVTAKLLNMEGAVSWTATGLDSYVSSASTLTANPGNMPGLSATITASINFNGQSYSESFVLSKVVDGTNGANGANGANGTNGANGVNGLRGNVQIAVSGYGSWSNSAAASAIASATGTSPIDRDQVTLYGGSFSETRFYQSGTWYTVGAFINGNLLVAGTLSASQIYGGTLDGIVLLSGSGNTPSGRAFEVNSSGGVFADSMSVGVFSATNIYSSNAPINAYSYKPTCAVEGGVYNLNASTSAHGVRGSNSNKNKSGAVGTAYGYAFYAEAGNYGPFTGAHDALIPNGTTIEPGDIVVDVECLARRGWSDTIFSVAVSSKACQPAVLGVLSEVHGPLAHARPAAFQEGFYSGVTPAGDTTHNQVVADIYHELKGLYQHATVNALGEGQMNVCGEGGNIEAGDLIVTSSIPGKGMRQADDVVRKYTVAKAREDVVFSSLSEIKQVACFYVCG